MAKGLWVILNVDNVDKSVEFYQRVGLKVRVESQDGMRWGTVNTRAADTGLVLMDKNQIAPGQAPDTRAWLSGELGKGVLVAIGVADAQKLWAKVEAASVTIDQPLRAQEWGGHEFTVVDPDGYVVNFSDKFPGMEPKKKVKKAAKKATRKVAKVAKRVTTKKRR